MGSVGGVGSVLACYCGWGGWRANLDCMLLLLLLLLLKYFPEEKNVKCFNFYKNEKMFQIDLNSDLKKEPDFKSRYCFTLL